MSYNGSWAKKVCLVVATFIACVWTSPVFAQTGLGSGRADIGETTSDDDFILFTPAFLNPQVKIHPIPFFSNTDQSFLDITDSSGNRYSLQANKATTGAVTSFSKLVMTIKDSSFATGQAQAVVYFDTNNLPVKIDFPDLGYIELTYTAGKSSSETEQYILSQIVTHIIDTNAFTVSGTLKKLIPCSSAASYCVPTIPNNPATTKTGRISLVSNTNFDPNKTLIDVFTSNGYAYGQFISPISTPYSRASTYQSDNYYTFRVATPLNESQFLANCMGNTGCALSYANCIFDVIGATGKPLQDVLENQIVGLPVNSTVIKTIKVISKIITKAHPTMIAMAIANTITEYAAGNMEDRCKQMYETDIPALTTSVTALAHGGVSGTVSSDTFDIHSVNSLPNLTISNLTCSDNNYIEGYDQGVTEYINIGAYSGSVKFRYETYGVEDRMQVYHGAKLIYDTTCIGTYGEKTATLNISDKEYYSNELKVVVTPNCSGGYGTAWYFIMGCATESAKTNVSNISDVLQSCRQKHTESKTIEQCIVKAHQENN